MTTFKKGDRVKLTFSPTEFGDLESDFVSMINDGDLSKNKAHAICDAIKSGKVFYIVEVDTTWGGNEPLYGFALTPHGRAYCLFGAEHFSKSE